MSVKIHFSLPGHPKAKGRARAGMRAGHAVMYPDKQTKSYEGMVRLAAEREMRGRPPTARPVVIHLAAIFIVPKSYSKKERALCLGGGMFPAKRPDLDNIVKIFTDAVNGVVFADDSQIVSMRCSKVYGETPQVAITVTEL